VTCFHFKGLHVHSSVVGYTTEASVASRFAYATEASHARGHVYTTRAGAAPGLVFTLQRTGLLLEVSLH
jgi:hypothetical protein